MDLNKLRTEVFEKTGIKIDTSDPVFALVALNEAVLSESVGRHMASMQQANETLGAQAGLLIEAGERYKKLLGEMASLSAGDMKPEMAAVLAAEAGNTSGRSAGRSPLEWDGTQWLAGAGAIALLSTLLTLGGMAILVQPEKACQPIPQPAPPAIAPLTPAQVQLIQNGEKYAKLWPRLDAATQGKIQKLLQQP